MMPAITNNDFPKAIRKWTTLLLFNEGIDA
jgi:hypothetical protein